MNTVGGSNMTDGRGYEIVADYEEVTIELHKATYEPQHYKFALQPLCFIAFVSSSFLLHN